MHLTCRPRLQTLVLSLALCLTAVPGSAQASSAADGDAAGALLLLFAYFLPVVMAQLRNHKNSLAIAVLNLFLGWTVLGWVVALVWACTSTDAGAQGQ